MAITGKSVNTVGKETVKQPATYVPAAIASGVANVTRTQHEAPTDPLKKLDNAHTKTRNEQQDGGGYIVTTEAAPAATPNYDRSVQSVFGDTSDPELTARYNNAMAALEQMKGQAPVYGSQYDAQIKSLYEQIMGRGEFKYDQKTDPLYQQYVQDYTTQGKMAMRDTMGQAAALTGGYGSSYGQAVGQQQYDQYLQRMADILPQTYGMALDAYNAEGNRLNQNLETTTNLERSDYDKYLDTLNQYNIDYNRAQNDVDTWYDRMVAQEKLNYSRQLDQYEMQKDQYNRLVNLMAMGYTPTVAEYNAAGLSQAQGEALRGAYMPAPETNTVYIKGGNNKSDKNNNPGSTSSFNSLLDKFLSSGAAAAAAGVSKVKSGTAKAKNK